MSRAHLPPMLRVRDGDRPAGCFGLSVSPEAQGRGLARASVTWRLVGLEDPLPRKHVPYLPGWGRVSAGGPSCSPCSCTDRAAGFSREDKAAAVQGATPGTFVTSLGEAVTSPAHA